MIQLGLTLPVETVLIGAMVVLVLIWVAVELKLEDTIRDAVRLVSAFSLTVLFMLLATASGLIVW